MLGKPPNPYGGPGAAAPDPLLAAAAGGGWRLLTDGQGHPVAAAEHLWAAQGRLRETSGRGFPPRVAWPRSWGGRACGWSGTRTGKAAKTILHIVGGKGTHPLPLGDHHHNCLCFREDKTSV